MFFFFSRTRIQKKMRARWAVLWQAAWLCALAALAASEPPATSVDDFSYAGRCEEPGERCLITRKSNPLPFAPVPVWKSSTLAFVSLGDWGCGAHNCASKPDPMHQSAGDTQLAVSNHMAESAYAVGSSFVLALGDNFYFQGVQSIKDPLFQEVWQTRFRQQALMTPWFAILGNHDHYGNAQAQIDFSKMAIDPRWVMPNYYYTTTREIPVTGQILQLVAIDTVILDEAYARRMLVDKIQSGVVGAQVLAEFDARAHVRAHAAVEQLDWLEETLASSTADWLIVMGHYPVYSGRGVWSSRRSRQVSIRLLIFGFTTSGEHGTTISLANEVAPLLEKYRVDAYFSGHDHTQQHIENAGVQYYVSGAGALRGSVKPISTTLFAAVDPGFMVHQVSGEHMTTTFMGHQGRPIYSHTIQRKRNVSE